MLEHLGFKKTKKKLKEAAQKYDDFAHSQEGKDFVNLFYDIKEKFGHGVASLAVQQISLTSICETIINVYRVKFNITGPQELIDNPSYKQAMIQDINEMITSLAEQTLEETIRDLTVVKKD